MTCQDAPSNAHHSYIRENNIITTIDPDQKRQKDASVPTRKKKRGAGGTREDRPRRYSFTLASFVFRFVIKIFFFFFKKKKGSTRSCESTRKPFARLLIIKLFYFIKSTLNESLLGPVVHPTYRQSGHTKPACRTDSCNSHLLPSAFEET